MRDFKNLSKFQEIQYNHILDLYKQKDERLSRLRAQLTGYDIDELFELNGEFQIAKVYNKASDNPIYVCFLNYKKLTCIAHTFDQALLLLLSAKYEGEDTSFPYYAARMLNMKFDEKV